MRILLQLTIEIIRIIAIYFIGSWLLWTAELKLYGAELALDHVLILFLANFILIFVIYRNLFQRKGWYTSDKTNRLSRPLTLILLGVTLLLLISVPIV
jgi:hypothetical protein